MRNKMIALLKKDLTTWVSTIRSLYPMSESMSLVTSLRFYNIWCHNETTMT